MPCFGKPSLPGSHIFESSKRFIERNFKMSKLLFDKFLHFSDFYGSRLKKMRFLERLSFKCRAKKRNREQLAETMPISELILAARCRKTKPEQNIIF